MTKKFYNPALDYLRIFAMFAVLWVHISVYIDMPDSVRPLFTWGGVGVQIFFVLSGYLAGYSILKKSRSTKEYYLNRCKRILPSYYTAIILAIIYKTVIVKDMMPDVFKIGWVRYFLGLNTILPSNAYDQWNNLYGWWTMSCFIGFYIMAPLIFKFVKNFKSSVCFLGISFVISAVWKILISVIFGRIAGLDSIDVLAGASSFGMLYQFAIGIIIFYTLEETDSKLTQQLSSKDISLIMMALFATVGVIIHKNAFVWCAITGIVILTTTKIKSDSDGKMNKTIKFIGGHSFNIYLIHFMSYDIAWKAINLITMDSMIRTILWIVLAGVLIVMFAAILHFVEEIERKVNLNKAQ